MAILTIQTIDRNGLVPVGVAADVAGDTVLNDGQVFLEFVNDGVSDIVVTLVTQSTVDSQAVADRTVTVSAGLRVVVGPFPVSYYNTDQGYVVFTYDSVLALTVFAYRIDTS